MFLNKHCILVPSGMQRDATVARFTWWPDARRALLPHTPYNRGNRGAHCHPPRLLDTGTDASRRVLEALREAVSGTRCGRSRAGLSRLGAASWVPLPGRRAAGTAAGAGAAAGPCGPQTRPARQTERWYPVPGPAPGAARPRGRRAHRRASTDRHTDGRAQTRAQTLT